MGKAATSNRNEVVREQKVPLCTAQVTELQRFRLLLSLHRDCFFSMLQKSWCLVGRSSTNVGIIAVLLGRVSALCKCGVLKRAVITCWVWIVTFIMDC